MNVKHTVLMAILLAAAVIMIVAPACAVNPDVYYYSGNHCTVPSDEHFLSYPTGILDYRFFVDKNTWDRGDINPNGNHYTHLSDRLTTFRPGQSKAEQEKLALTKVVYCYTIPDPIDEARFPV